MEKQNVVAIIGCGIIVRNRHIKALSEMDNVRIKYACDIIPGKAEKLKEDYPKIENAILD
jgi:predicted dehydrogenase